MNEKEFVKIKEVALFDRELINHWIRG